MSLPETSERLSHGELTFCAHNHVFAMCADNHHGDTSIAVWLPVPPALEAQWIPSAPRTRVQPPCVSGRGRVGIELKHIADEDLRFDIQLAWELIAPRRLLIAGDAPARPARVASPAGVAVDRRTIREA